MKILVTGGAGFIGQHLCRELCEHGHDVFSADVIYPFPLGYRDNDRVGRINCADEHDAAKVVDREQPDVVVHLAAKVGRLFGEDDSRKTILDNAWMTTNMARVCGDRGIRLVYASTSEVYGDRDEHLCREDEPFVGVPHNIYGLSKRWGEEAAQLYAPDRLTLLRFSMPYGPGLPAGRGRAALINFLHDALHRQPITVHRGAERSWCWIGDTVRAARLVIEQTGGGAFNVGRDDNALPLRQVAEMACDLVGADPDALIREIDPPQRQTVVKRLATDKIRQLGWQPEVELEEGMRRTLEWVKARYQPKLAAAA